MPRHTKITSKRNTFTSITPTTSTEPPEVSSWSPLEYQYHSPVISSSPYYFEYDDNLVDRVLPLDPVISSDTLDDDDIDIVQWQAAVEISINKLKSIPEGNNFVLTCLDLFTLENNSRYIVKSRPKQYFELFPWFIYISQRKKSFRFRESLKNVTLIVDALNFFWNNPLQEEDFVVVEEFYRSPPVRHLTPIFELKQKIERNRSNIQFRQRVLGTLEQQHQRLIYLEKVLLVDTPPFKKSRSEPIEERLLLESELAVHELRINTLESSIQVSNPMTFNSSDSTAEIESDFYPPEFKIDSNIILTQASMRSNFNPPNSTNIDLLLNKTTRILDILNSIRSSSHHSTTDKNTHTHDLHNMDQHLNSILLALQSYLK